MVTTILIIGVFSVTEHHLILPISKNNWFKNYLPTTYKATLVMLDTLLHVTTLASLLIIGGVESNPGPTNRKTQLQIITQNARGLIDARKKKLFINKVQLVNVPPDSVTLLI